MNRTEENSLLYWYKHIKDLEIPQPKTEIVMLSRKDISNFFEFKMNKKLKKKIDKTIEKLGYPIFFRTDQSSYKHNWKEASFIETKKDIERCIYRTIEHNLCCGILGLPFKALVFREYIPLFSKFRAFRGDLPIAKERRYFIKNGEVQCHHPYWVMNSIINPNKEDWKEILSELNKEKEKEINQLTKYALEVASILRGYWSIDFAYSKEKKWYLIDMARGEDSFHKLDCQFCPDDIKKYYEKRNKKRNKTNI
jgi:hypothetical protein